MELHLLVTNNRVIYLVCPIFGTIATEVLSKLYSILPDFHQVLFSGNLHCV